MSLPADRAILGPIVFAAPASAAWPRHEGAPGPADADYLVGPDAAIGPVISAETNRKRGGFYPMDTTYRRLVLEYGLFGLFLGWVCGALSYTWPSLDVRPWSSDFDATGNAIALGSAAVGALVLALVSRALRRRRSSYVGRFGLQSHVAGAMGGARTEVVRFADCSQLKVLRTRHLYNGSYTHTSFRYELFDPHGRPRFLIKGRCDDRRPHLSDQLRFALAAEKAWNARPRA